MRQYLFSKRKYKSFVFLELLFSTNERARCVKKNSNFFKNCIILIGVQQRLNDEIPEDEYGYELREALETWVESKEVDERKTTWRGLDLK